MKLLKKLLPIATVASVAAVITPMSSCATSGSGWIDGTKKLNTKGFKKCKTEDLPETMSDVNLETVHYAEAVKNNKQIVYDDFAWHLSTLNKLVGYLPFMAWSLLPSEIGLAYINVNELKGQLSNFDVNTVKYTASYDIQLRVDLDVVMEVPALAKLDFDSQIKVNVAVDANVQYKDCPFMIWQDYVYGLVCQAEKEQQREIPDMANGLAFMLNPDRLPVDTSWSINLMADLDVKATNPDVELGIDLSTNGNYKFNASILTGLLTKAEQLFMVVGILGGWSTYYYSDFVVPRN